jgi:lycopene cyclase domain-containing protein
LWVLALKRFVFKSAPAFTPRIGVRKLATFVVALIWMISTLYLVLGPVSGTYLTLILSWVLLPVMIQIAFGADILLANWRLLLAAIFPPTLYLWLVDAIAIASGTWTINPAQTTGIKVGPLPLEEMVFFLMTNLIIAFGVTLMLSEESKRRGRAMLTWLRGLTNTTNERMARMPRSHN